MSIKIIKKNIEQHLSVINKLDDNFQSLILSVSQIMSETLRNGNTIFWCGNGGSASDSQHLAAELVGRYDKERKPLRSISLTSDSSTLTCIANDYSFNNIFSRQLEGLAKEGDMVVGISTSGNSANIINVFKTAKTLKVKSLALLGKDAKISDTNSFESVWKAMNKKDFPWKSNLNEIVVKFTDLLRMKGLPFPSELGVKEQTSGMKTFKEILNAKKNL